jgi:REP element-mobilizing transposase RayT
MARLARIAVVNTPHHVTQRGNGRQSILESDNERLVYLELLRHCAHLRGLTLLGYCLMSNHVHCDFNWTAELMTNEKVNISIGKPEALILFELLADFHSQPVLEFKDNAERLALVRLHGALQSTLVEPFSKDYDQLVSDARRHLLKQWGTVDG